MAVIGENVATHVAESLADKAMRELHYLCCYKSYVDDFEVEKTSLSARRSTVRKDIEEAKDRNENQIESEVELWLSDADAFINEDTTGKKKWFGVVTNYFWQYNRGKDLEDKKRRIQELVKQSNNFTRVARPTPSLGIKFYYNENFMQLKDRKLQFGKLTEALKNDKKFVIGLHGLGGTGKTTMAIEVGKEVEESKVFDKVIFSVVSKDPNLRNIRDHIAKQLKLDFKEGTEQAQELWKRIAEGGEKVLLILDDVWEELSMQDLGIPLGRHGKSCCSMLLTTRYRKVCIDMGCPEPIELEVLSEKDAVDLFLSYADKNTDSSSNGFNFKDVALGIVKECGRLPIAIVAVARALKSKPLKEWKQCLERLRNPKSIHDVNEDLKQAYNSLRLSYDYLQNEEAKQLFLLCSLFPDDYEIPIELLTRIAISMKRCGGANKYCVARSYFTPIINVLLDSCLLLKVENENEAVKMHDLVQEVALWIGNKLVQVVMDSSTTLKENIIYSCWNINDFPSHFVGRKLEALLLWISNNTDSTIVKVSDGIFEGMENLKFLALMDWSNISILGASLFQSHPSLINVRSLTIKGSVLGDISFLLNLKSLESLELSNCSLIELPKEVSELEKLRLLEMVRCDIEKNNPFKVIGSCWQLEELYFISRYMYEDTCESLAQITTFPELERYYIAGWRHSKVDFSVSGYFDSNYLSVNFSDEIFKSLVAKAEVLKLDGDYYNRGWTNVFPDILRVKDDSMEDHLTTLWLQSMNGIKCLVLTKCLRSDVAIFSKLVKLKLYDMDVRELCRGPYPVNFLKQLKKLHLSHCKNLEGSLFDRKLELCNLKSIYLHTCSMSCLFHPFTAQSLKQLEMLDIDECFLLNYIVAQPMEDHDPNQKSHDSMFPKLKYLRVRSCPELEFILPICFCKDLPLLESIEIVGCEKLEYVFGQYPDERDLHQMGKEAILQSLEELKISGVPNFINLYAECYLPCPCSDKVQKSSPSANVEDFTSSLSRGLLCCFWSKSNASMNHNEAMKVNYVVNRAHGLFTSPLYPSTLLTRLEIYELIGLKSLFTPSVASSLKLLETLKVGLCGTLEHIITDKEDDHDHMNVNSIFPTLREVKVYSCSNLEYLFPAFYSKNFKDLEYVWIEKAENLRNVFGKCQADQNHNVHIDLNLPALKRLYLSGIPNIVSICAQNYSMKEPYLEDISLDRCPQLPLETLVAGDKRQEDLSRIKALPPLEEKGKPLYNLQELPNQFKEPKSYMSFQNLSKLTIKGYKELKFIFSPSTLRRLQKLRQLEVEDCEEIVSIVEDQENKKNPMAPHQVLFPELRTIEVRDCKSMEYLFSISSGKLPRLLCMDIRDNPQLGEVIRWKHGEGQKLVMEDVFPKLCVIRLENLPTLHTICQGIDFHTVKWRRVRECPSISLTSANDSWEELYKLLESFKRNSVHEDEDANYLTKVWSQWSYKDIVRVAVGVQKAALHFMQCPTKHKQQNRISPNFSLSEEVSQEIVEEDSTTNSNLPNLTKSTKTSANEIVEEKLSTTPSSDLDMSVEVSQEIVKEDSTTNSNLSNLIKNTETSENEIVEEQLPSSNAAATPSSNSNRESCGKESKCDQEALGEGLSLNEGHQRVKEPTNDLFTKETTKKVAMESFEKESKGDQESLGEDTSLDEGPRRVKVPTNDIATKETTKKVALTIPHATTTKMTSPRDSSICTSKKPQITTSTTHTEPTISQSDLFDISITTECPQNLKATFGEGPSLEKYDQTSSSTYSKTKTEKPYTSTPSTELCGKESMDDQQALGESRSSNETPQRIEEPCNIECSSKDTSKKRTLTIPPSITETTSPPKSLICSPKKPENATSAAHVEIESGSSAIIDQYTQGQIMVNQRETSIEDDLTRLFRIMRDGSDMELSYVSNIDAFEDDKVAKAFSDIESSLKMDLNQIAISEEHTHRLENALNFLSTHFSEEETSSHGLVRRKIESLHQEVQRVISSFKQSSDMLNTLTKLKEKDKWIDEQHSQRLEAATTLVCEIRNSEDYMNELKEQICRLQDELKRKEKEFEDYEIKLSSLQKQKKECVWETIGFMEEYEAVKKDKSYVGNGQTKARQELKKLENQWLSCVANLRKTSLLLGILLKHKP